MAGQRGARRRVEWCPERALDHASRRAPL